ncbi:anthranilate synthase component II [Alkalibacillus haloalkaliphilus]|uniref:anthranilate synthase component II n=1 Tax=Alkalibacillus haloalkaliphilus TaxID=94136 RepID=UPI002936B001|nr:aminodeoxychorismate/anthranilate synthase component II [Alkalibacillus haloalkaliphilus]MDV2581311.1 aminodeoxychorismate/anthranilate synthase component II [Alkalibacillus haloalkaliphilus]
MIVMIDHYDSFTYNLVDYFEQAGVEVKVVKHDEVTVEELQQLNVEAVVYSPGPGQPNDVPNSVEILRAVQGEIPVLGVCLGFQIIVQSFGGTIEKAGAPMHGKIEWVTHDNKGVYDRIQSPTAVTRYHSLIARKDNIPKELQITGETDDGEVMSVRHKHWPIEAVQFHPEAILTTYGLKMVENFVVANRLTRQVKQS